MIIDDGDLGGEFMKCNDYFIIVLGDKEAPEKK